MGVLIEGQMSTFFINGHLVESIVRSSELLYEGHFALYLGTGQEVTSEVMFDDFSLRNNP